MSRTDLPHYGAGLTNDKLWYDKPAAARLTFHAEAGQSYFVRPQTVGEESPNQGPHATSLRAEA
ncbi:MAG: hypothetical protein O2923_10015 [Verrucomicrobia bacterium]|nr:hypothetical protein [Verrucomicrobiota bacterium]MDA1086994.1 hypothetical protein [Verrucomicrobiota bacterium]